MTTFTEKKKNVYTSIYIHLNSSDRIKHITATSYSVRNEQGSDFVANASFDWRVVER